MLWAIGQYKNFLKTPLSYISATQLKIVMGKKNPFRKKKHLRIKLTRTFLESIQFSWSHK